MSSSLSLSGSGSQWPFPCGSAAELTGCCSSFWLNHDSSSRPPGWIRIMMETLRFAYMQLWITKTKINKFAKWFHCKLASWNWHVKKKSSSAVCFSFVDSKCWFFFSQEDIICVCWHENHKRGSIQQKVSITHNLESTLLIAYSCHLNLQEKNLLSRT